MDLIHAHQGLNMELCMVPRAFSLPFLLENKIMREFEGGFAFYEPGKVTPKPRNKTNTLQVEVLKKMAKEDKYTVEWLVNEFIEFRERQDIMFDRITEMWNAMKVSRSRAETSKKQENKAADLQGVKNQTEDPPVDEDVADAEEEKNEDGEETMDSDKDSDQRNKMSEDEEEAEEELDVAGADEEEDDEETAKLAQLAKEADMESKRLEKEKKMEEKEAAGATPAPQKKSAPIEPRKSQRKRKDPLQGSPDTRPLRSKRRR